MFETDSDYKHTLREVVVVDESSGDQVRAFVRFGVVDRRESAWRLDRQVVHEDERRV